MSTTQKQVINTITIKHCDFCSKTSETNGVYITKCGGCNKDICNSCSRYVYDLHEPSSDCNYKVCKSCAEKADQYKEKAYLIREKAFNNIERLVEKWKEECGRDIS